MAAAPAAPAAPPIGELRDETWRAKHRPDSLFGSAVVEDGMRCYVLLTGAGACPLRIGVRELTMNHALLQVVREMVMNCTDLLQRDPDFRKVSVSFDAATGGITVLNDGRGIPVGKGLIQLHGESAARLADLWSPTLLLARWGCSSNYDDDRVRFTAGKNGLGAKAVLAWCRRVELRAVDSVRKLSFEQHWEDGMRVESAPKVKASSRVSGFTEIKLWPDYERLVRLPLPLTEEQVGALRWCVWECASILPKGDRFGVAIDGCALPDHTTEGMMRAVMALCAEASSPGAGGGASALLSATAPLKTARSKGSAQAADEGAGAEDDAEDSASRAGSEGRQRGAAAPPPLFRAHVSWPPHNEALTGFAFPTHAFAPGIAAQLPPLGFVNGVPCPRGTHRQRWESAMTTDLGKALGASSAGMTKGSYLQHFFLAASARINQPRFGSQTKDELVTRLPPAATLSGSALPRSALARCGLLAHLKQLSAQRAEAEAMKAASEQLRGSKVGAASGSGPPAASSRRRYDVDDVEHYEGAELAGRHPDCYLFLTEGLSAQNCARNVIARLDPELKRRCGSFALRGKLINAMVQPAAKVLANKEVQGLLRICNLNPTQRYETAAQRATLRYAKLMLWTDADTDGGHIAWLVFLLVFKFWPELAARGFVERFVTPLLKVTNGAGGAAALQFYSEVARDRWLEGLAAEPARGLHALAPSDPLLTADMRRRALDEAVVSRGCRMKYYKGLGRLMAEDEKDLAARFDRLRIRLMAEEERDVAMVRALGADDADARREIQTTRAIRALPYDDVEQVSVSDFVDGELLAYMRDANLRQIPAVDGFVEVQRMIVAYFYVTRESAADSADGQVVARLAAAIAAKMDYHHGETSMAGAIATMAQDFAGKNNLNLLRPMGQFGERSEPTPGQPRYTCTALEPYVRTLFPEADYAALPRPRHGEVPVVMPGVIPLLLVNGASGIGYGHSTEIPPHDPRRILRACRDWLEVIAAPSASPAPTSFFSKLDDVGAWAGPEAPPPEFARRCADILPWVRGLSRQPEVEDAEGDEAEAAGAALGGRAVLSWGRAEISADMRSLRVTELPAGVWTKNARAALAKVRWLDSVYMHPRIATVLITADIPDPSLVPAEVRAEVQAGGSRRPESGMKEAGPQLLRALKLVRRVSYSNMKAFDRTGVALKTFPDLASILHEFAILRLWVYERRKVLELRRLREEEGQLFGRRRFVELQVAGELDLRAFPNRRAVHEHLELHHPSIPAPYAYLNGVDVWQLTREEVARLVERHAAVCRERAALEAMTAADLWRRDLDAVEQALSTQWRSEAQPEAQGEPSGARAAAGGKAVVLRGGKPSAGKKRARA
jgi:DNA gyrase/topoisomerase IV subunit B